MGIEIERKFLVAGDGWRVGADGGTPIVQGYVADDGERSVRIRRKGDTHILTIKAARAEGGRWEFEYPVPAADAQAMFEQVCTAPAIDKVRYTLPAGQLTWEIDVFAGANAGLVVAEIELPSAETPFERPDWLGPEVSDDERFLNANLYVRPFGGWGVSFAELLSQLS